MSFDLERIYKLLPALYQIRDAQAGNAVTSGDSDESGPLKSILALVAEQVAALEKNLDQLYDDQFIETCADWVIPYIGDLVGTRGLIPIPGISDGQQRAEVANTIGYRRRKGTASIIEQLARDVTGWDANVVEYFRLLSTTQYMKYLRPENKVTADIRNKRQLEYINSPFDKLPHTLDVRRIGTLKGKYNIQNIGIFLWRLQSFSMTHSPAYKLDSRRYTFNALGKDIRLYNKPVTEETITHLAEPANVSSPISRTLFKLDPGSYYGEGKSITIYIGDAPVLPTEEVKINELLAVCNLGDVVDENGIVTGWANMPHDIIAIDPLLGRIAFPSSAIPMQDIYVSYYYGFSAPAGGGEYAREDTFLVNLPAIVKVSSGEPGAIQKALDDIAETGGVVEIQDNNYYFELPVITVAEGKTIELRAAENKRPVLVLDGELLIEAGANATVIFNGLLIAGGRIRVPLIKDNGETSQLQSLCFRHCTLLPEKLAAIGTVPGQPNMTRLVVEISDVVVEIDKTITGNLQVHEGSKVIVRNSIIDAGQTNLTAYTGASEGQPGGVLNISCSTVIGRVYTRIMEMASNCIFLAESDPSDNGTSPVRAQRLQQGCVRFSYLPVGSKLPRPYRCQPATIQSASFIRPMFTSLQYGDAGYCQLSKYCATEISEGADDEAEMGAFHDLFQPQRKANLQTRLNEYLRFGMETGIFYAS